MQVFLMRCAPLRTHYCIIVNATCDDISYAQAGLNSSAYLAFAHSDLANTYRGDVYLLILIAK